MPHNNAPCKGIRNPTYFPLWNLESRTVESGFQTPMESGIWFLSITKRTKAYPFLSVSLTNIPPPKVFDICLVVSDPPERAHALIIFVMFPFDLDVSELSPLVAVGVWSLLISGGAIPLLMLVGSSKMVFLDI